MNQSPSAARPRTVGIAGFGAVGRELAHRIAEDLPEYDVAAVSARRTHAAEEYVAAHGWTFQVLPLAQLADHADIVIECAPAAVFRELAEPVLRSGKTLVVLSSGALLSNWDLVDLAASHGARIVVPSGALLGLDAVQAAAQGTIENVTMVTRKPPVGLQDAPYVREHGIDLTGCTEPRKLFHGTAREAAEGFPANLNVAVALSMAGVGPDRTTLEIWADPHVNRNTHTITVDSDSARLSMTIENIPSENPKTGKITALSVIALLHKMAAPLAVGT